MTRTSKVEVLISFPRGEKDKTLLEKTKGVVAAHKYMKFRKIFHLLPCGLFLACILLKYSLYFLQQHKTFFQLKPWRNASLCIRQIIHGFSMKALKHCLSPEQALHHQKLSSLLALGFNWSVASEARGKSRLSSRTLRGGVSSGGFQHLLLQCYEAWPWFLQLIDEITTLKGGSGMVSDTKCISSKIWNFLQTIIWIHHFHNVTFEEQKWI